MFEECKDEDYYFTDEHERIYISTPDIDTTRDMWIIAIMFSTSPVWLAAVLWLGTQIRL